MDRWTSVHPQDKKAVQAPVEEKRLNVVMPCWKGDEDQAIALLNWIAEMGMVQAPFYLLCDNECNVKALSDAARKAFSMPQFLEDRERIKSNWHEVGDHPKSAAGPNSLFRQAAWFFYLPVGKGPWLFLEPDAIPCTPDWYERLVVEYRLGKRPFMGHKVTPVNHPGVPEHMSGVAIYSEATPMIAASSVKPSEVAFDIAGCNEFLKQAYFSPLIYHKYRAPGFTSQEDFDERVPRHIALWHACKDQSIYPYLRKRLGYKGGDENCATNSQLMDFAPAETRNATPVTVTSNGAGSTITPIAPMDIFIKTRAHDKEWYDFCLLSIRKFASGFRTTFTKFDENDKQPGYLWQQVCKLHADEHTDAEWILFMDSDCVFTQPVSPGDFIHDGKPIWLYTPLDKARPDQHVWAPVMEKFLGKKPEHEFMRRHPFVVQRWMLDALRTFCKYRHGKSLEDYIMGEADPENGLALRFSEWNCLGFFLWEYHRDKVHWVLDSEAGPPVVYQGFTHGGEQRKLEDIAKFREILDGPEVKLNPLGGGTSEPRPVLDLTEKSAIAFLASQVRDNFHKARIMRDLKKAWKGKGEAPRKKKQAGVEVPALMHTLTDGVLLCIHSYPGANKTVKRHWKNYELSGASRIVGIGTDDGKCEFPCESVTIGKNAYMKTTGSDDHLCRRLLDTVKFCMEQPEERFIIAEYDVLFLREFPDFEGVCAFKTGDRINGSHSPAYYHGPWCFDKQSGEKLIKAMEMALPLSDRYPNNSPDVFFGLACDMAGIEVTCPWEMFTRNSLDVPGDLELAVEAAESGVHCIHGVKNKNEFVAITKASLAIA